MFTDNMKEMNMMKNVVKIAGLSCLLLFPLSGNAQRTLTLETCRRLAVENNKDLQLAQTQVEIAGLDRKIALANYFPEISATGAYFYNNESIHLISDAASGKLQNMGTAVQQQFGSLSEGLMAAILANPKAVAEYMQSPLWQTVLGALSKQDLSQVLNVLGSEIDNAFHPDLQNIFAGAVSVRQPVFTGGKIAAANHIAKLAEQLSEIQYDQQYQQVVVDIDQAYWEIVSIAQKKALARSYADLLHQMERDVALSVQEGVSTESDALQIRVKANEADLLLTKSTNGLTLAKMLLCKQIGLALDTDIVLADEGLEKVPVPLFAAEKELKDIYRDRPETRSLELAGQIYDGKVAIARADMLPKVALTANYLITNPSLKNGFQKEWNGMFNAGVMVNVPIFHGFEALQKTRKAKAEATLCRLRLDDARRLIHLQVSRLRKQEQEAMEKLTMADNNLSSAEENLRAAAVGFEAGIINANTALGAHTAWLQAHSDYIDAGIELQMLAANLNKAEGNHHEQMDNR